MNSDHERLCASPEWAAHLRSQILTPLVAGVELGAEMLELGPGPGAATDWLRQRVRVLTALELDAGAARRLERRYAATNVTVVVGDCANTTFEDESFDSVATFTMLHHLPSSQLQRATLAEAFRVLRPGGVLIGSDSIASNDLHDFHADDTYNPIDPARLLVHLQSLGFDRITLSLDEVVKFVASKAGVPDAPPTT
ncbi:MAG: class I SAM-dependent methyltransferase [Acidimicrobiales bacterium]